MNYTMDLKYAVTALNYLSNNEGVVKLDNIATAKNLSLNFLEQVFRKLRIAGIVKSARGHGGGYVLISKDVSVGDVIVALAVKSTSKKKENDSEAIKKVDNVFKQLDNFVLSESHKIKISTIQL